MSEPLILSAPSLDIAAREIFSSALTECALPEAVARAVRVEMAPEGRTTLQIGELGCNLEGVRQIRIVAAGKAAASLLQAFLPHLPAGMDCAGIVSAPAAPADVPLGFQFFSGGHPVPNQASFAAASAALEMLQSIASDAAPQTLCLFLISGGASAMLELPLNSAISLDDTIAFHRALVHSGGSIAEINCVRKHFSAVKGGRLALLAQASPCVTILVSDVPPGCEDTVGSGPTLPDNTTCEDCLAILTRYGLLDRLPASVRDFFLSADLVETPKPSVLNSRTVSLLGPDDLAEAARRHAERLGFHALIDNTCDDWDYRAAADYLLARLRVLRRIHSRVCLISVGEVTVQAPDPRLLASGNGGRNQQFALYAATRLEAGDAPIAVLSAGSDGIDGNSSEAGAVVDQGTLQGPWLRAAAQDALQQFRSAELLQGLGATIRTGPTGNNLRDLRLLIAGEGRSKDDRTSPAP